MQERYRARVALTVYTRSVPAYRGGTHGLEDGWLQAEEPHLTQHVIEATGFENRAVCVQFDQPAHRVVAARELLTQPK